LASHRLNFVEFGDPKVRSPWQKTRISPKILPQPSAVYWINSRDRSIRPELAKTRLPLFANWRILKGRLSQLPQDGQLSQQNHPNRHRKRNRCRRCATIVVDRIVEELRKIRTEFRRQKCLARALRRSRVDDSIRRSDWNAFTAHPFDAFAL
jgi:hypothetical protein